MFLLLCLVGAYELPDKAENLRGGIFSWAKALAGQRIFLKGQTFPGLGWKVYNEELNMKTVGKNVIGKVFALNISDMLGGTLNSLTGSTDEGSESEPSQNLAVLDGTTVTGCASLDEENRKICVKLGLDSYASEEYWGMPMAEFFGSLIAYVAVVVVLLVFFVVSFLYYCVFMFGCCCCCCPKRHSFPGLCNLITMSLACALMAIATIIYMCGWIGIGTIMEVYKTYDQEDGLVVQVLDGLESALTNSFDNETGFPSVLLPLVDTTEIDLKSDMDNITDFVNDFIKIGPKVESIFNDIESNNIGTAGKEGTVIQLITANNDIIERQTVPSGEDKDKYKIETKSITNAMDKTKETITGMLDNLNQAKTLLDIPTMIDEKLSPNLDKVRDIISNPIDKLFKGKDVKKMFADLKEDIIGDTGFSADIKAYDKLIKNAYNAVTGFYMLFGVILFGIIAIWMTAFFTYTSCSRCVVNCSCCCPCLCSCCCLITGFVGSVGCVFTFYALTWGIELGDGAVQGFYYNSFGDELVIPEMNMSGMSNGFITESIKFEPIKMASADDLNILDSVFKTDASAVKDLVTWLHLDSILPITEITKSVRSGLRQVLDGVQLPEDIRDQLDKAADQIRELNLSTENIFGDVNEEKINEMKSEVDKIDQMNGEDKKQFKENCDKLRVQLQDIQKKLGEASTVKDDLADRLETFGGDAVVRLTNCLYNALSNLLSILDNLFPALKTVDLSICIKVINCVINLGLVSIARLMTCMSISAHLLFFAMFVSVLMLWVRRPGMQPADFENPPEKLGDEDESSDKTLNVKFIGTGDEALPNDRLLDSAEVTRDPLSSTSSSSDSEEPAAEEVMAF